jgi:uncharacterized protein (TIGR02246 family)
MRNAIFLIVLIVGIGASAGFAAEARKEADKALAASQPPSTQTADEKAIRASAEKFVTAFNKGDAKEIAALWTTDCEYVDETGRVFRGRDAIEKEYAAFFALHPGLKIEISISSVDILGGHSAIEDGTAVVKNTAGALVSRGSYTAIHVKHGDQWLMASVRERAAPLLSGRPTFKDLGWLIGNWSATKDSQSVDLRFQWIADRKFIELSYNARDKDSAGRSGMQIIGVDPLSGEVISWTFDSTGGHGQGKWRLLKKGLIIESWGMMPDGTPTTSTEIVSRINGESFSWQSVNRRVAGQSLSDEEPVVLKRTSR